MKLQRWDWDEHYMHECSYGDWCASEDVSRIEASRDELLQTLYKCGQLLEILHVEDVEINKLINEHYHLVRDVVVKFGGEDLNSMD